MRVGEHSYFFFNTKDDTVALSGMVGKLIFLNQFLSSVNVKIKKVLFLILNNLRKIDYWNETFKRSTSRVKTL